MVTALILPEIWTTELTQLKMWTVWCSSVFSILIDLLSSWFSCDTSVVWTRLQKGGERRTMIHLFPSSSSIFAGFFAGFAPGLGLRGGAFFALSGTVSAERSAGFLWVIWELSTFRNPEVTAPPRFRSAKRAAVPEAGGTEAAGAEPEGGGGGGGGADGAEEVSGIDEGAGEPYAG